MIVFILIVAFFNQCDALIAYDCSQTKTFTPISLSSTPICVRNKTNTPIQKAHIQILQTKSYDSIEITSCLVIYDILITNCGSFFRNNLIVSKYNHVVQLSKENCNFIHNFNSYTDPQFPHLYVKIKNNEATFEGTVVGNNKDSKCEGGTFHAHRKSLGILENVHVFLQATIKIYKIKGTVDIKDKSVSFPSGYSYPFRNQQTFDPVYGHSFWSNNLNNNDCVTQNVFVVYEGTVDKIEENFEGNETRTIYLLPDDNQENRNFLLEKMSPINICGENAFTTQSLSIFIVESSNNVFKRKKDSNVNERNFATTLFLSMKLSQLSYSIGLQMTDLFREFQYQNCLSNYKIISNTLTMAISSPENFAYNHYKRPGIISFIRSDVLYIAECTAVNVTYREEDTCTNELPVSYLNKPFYVKPRSRILVTTPEFTTCSTIIPNTFQIDGNWMSKHGKTLLLTKSPIEIVPNPHYSWSYQPMSAIDTGIYSEQEIASYQKIIEKNLNLRVLTNNFINDISIPNGYGVTNAFSYEDFKTIQEKFHKSIYKRIKETATEIGSFTSFIIGIFIIIKTLQFIINIILNILILGSKFGYSNWRILMCFFNHCVTLFVREENSN
jgi:hypothetical protein